MSNSEVAGGKDAEDYQNLLNRLGLEDKETGPNQNREHRRFFFDIPETKFTLIIEDEVCLLHDVSVGGLSFFAKTQYGTDETLDLDFDSKFHLKVSVVNSFLSKVEPMDGETFSRYGCRFLNRGDGYRCVVAVLNQYLKSLVEKA